MTWALWISLGLLSFLFGFIAACMFAMGGRMSDIEDRERDEWLAEHIKEPVP